MRTFWANSTMMSDIRPGDKVKSIPAIIPFFKEKEKLDRCVAALKKSTYQPIELFIRDNTNDNILFTAAVNQGLRKYCYDPNIDYVLILNQDAYLSENTVENLVKFMASNPSCGIACPIQTAGPDKIVTWGGSLQGFPFGAHRRGNLSSYKEPIETYWANGACILIRTVLVREIGLFDQNMKFICSDSDFSFTARARGWKVWVVPDALVEHSFGGSEDRANDWLNKIIIEDALYFSKKWVNGELYRELSFEGANLTMTGIKIEVDKLKMVLNSIKQKKI